MEAVRFHSSVFRTGSVYNHKKFIIIETCLEIRSRFEDKLKKYQSNLDKIFDENDFHMI